MNPAIESLSSRREEIADRRTRDLPAARLADRLRALGSEGFAAFEEQGIPTRRLEDWKGTNLAALEEMRFSSVGSGSTAGSALDDSTRARTASADLVFLNGKLLPAPLSRSSLPEGVRVLSLAEAATENPEIPETFLGELPDLKRESMSALQTALFEDVAIVSIESRARADRPIRVCSVSSAEGPELPSAAFPRLLVVAAPHSEATVIFESVSQGEAPGLTAFVAEYHLAAGARIETVQVQAESSDRIHFTSSHARLEADARFDSHVFSLGDGLVRSELAVTLDAPGAETRMRGFFLGRNQAHIDHFTNVDHAAEHCTSDEEYRGVLDDASKGVFRGRVVVRPGAQKTDARQSNPNLLLSDRATIDTKPQLEIYADDVKASHGSTIGQLDAEAIFFLRARGISESDARLVLTRGFAHSIVEGIADEPTRESVAEQVEAALASLQKTEKGEPR